MLDHTGPLGSALGSPVTWFVIAAGLVVLALTASTRRRSAARHDGSMGARFEPSPVRARARYADAWSAAQASFARNPRVGCRQAQAIVAGVLEARGFPLTSELLDRRYRNGCAITARAHVSNDELRRAFFDFRGAFDALVADECELLDP